MRGKERFTAEYTGFDGLMPPTRLSIKPARS